MRVRACAPADLPAVQAIYAHHVLNGFGTFEEVPPTIAEMTARYSHISSVGYPFLVCAEGGRILGYAYAGEFRARSGYRFTCESTVYVASDAIRQGSGLALMHALIAACDERGLREMLAVIGDSENHGSIGLHRALGFELVGTFRKVGYKLGRWVDVVLMQLTLKSGQR